jgi:glycosyltransferase involved in cell wall biosynthesis
MKAQALSIVIPVYSGEEFIRPLFEEINAYKEHLKSLKAPIQLREVIFVNDDAADDSQKIIEDITKVNDWVMLVNLSRNFGQHQATVAGVLHSSSDWVVTMDEDLQHHPRFLLAMMLKLLQSKADICYARPKDGPHTKLRNLASRYVKSVIASISGTPQAKLFNSFRLVRGDIARAAAAVVSHRTYFDIALTWFSTRATCVELDLVDARLVSSGKSGYRFSSLMSHAKTLFISSEIKPLKFASIAGLTVAVSSFIVAFYISIMKFINPNSIDVAGWASTFVITAVLGGTCIFLLGLVLDHLSYLSQAARGRPVFFAIDRSRDEQILNWLQTLDPDDHPSI